MSSQVFEIRVAFPDTDAMSVVHHSHYLDYFDKARRHWCADDVLLQPLSYQVSHRKPALFDDLLRIHGQWRQEDGKTCFQYAVFRRDEKLTDAQSTHPAVPGLKDSAGWNADLVKF